MMNLFVQLKDFLFQCFVCFASLITRQKLERSPNGVGRSPNGVWGEAPSYILAAKPERGLGRDPKGVWGEPQLGRAEPQRGLGRSPQLHSCGEAAPGSGAEPKLGV
ncbi:MAG: hypothetical protein GY696_32860 [Gammaproteobacteria bacterium]|nr:hypothetical protein [Gammaproteobacteria bacterium]